MARGVATRIWRESAPETIERELASAWRDMAGAAPIARAVMANLVVYREQTRARTVDFEAIAGDVPIDAVVAQHPSRVILVDHERQDAPRSPFAAGAGIAVFGVAPAQYGVEQIAVRSACAERSLPSIVRWLLRGGVPTSVWWTEDISRVPPLEPIVRMARQLVYDSRRCRDVRRGIVALKTFVEGEPPIDLADVNWRRLSPLRRALLHAARGVDLAALRRGAVRVICRPGDAALAWLAVGWLAARMHWPPGGMPTIEEHRRGDDVLSIAIGTGRDELLVTLSTHRVAVRHRSGAVTPFAMPVPREEEADAVAAELRNLARDVCLHDAVAALIRTFEMG